MKLEKLLNMKQFMKIAIDGEVEPDESGNYPINVGYLRVSTDRQAEQGFGLDIQENDILRCCAANGFENLVLFIDDGYTGTNMDRPALQEIIALISQFNSGRSRVRVDSFVISRIDRLGRTLLGTLQFIQDYIVCKKDSKNSAVNRNAEDINFISVAENYCRIDKNNPQGKFLLMLFASLAEFDRDLIVDKMRRGRTSRAASGKWMGGGRVPFGYRYDIAEGRLIIAPQEAEIVREIFRLYVEEKMTPQRIAERFGFASDKSITQILRRKSLTGCIIWHGAEYPGEHEAIIPLERWEEAQRELERRSAHRNDTHYLLSGLLYCGECGAKMRYQRWGSVGSVKILCYSTQRSTAKNRPYLAKSEDCTNLRFDSFEIEDAVVSRLFDLSYIQNAENRKNSSVIDTVGVLEEKVQTELDALRALYRTREKLGTDEVLEEEIMQHRRRVDSLRAHIAEEKEKGTVKRRVEQVEKVLRTLQNTWPHMTPVERQSVCQALIERVVVYKSGNIDLHLRMQSFISEKNVDISTN